MISEYVDIIFQQRKYKKKLSKNQVFAILFDIYIRTNHAQS